MTPLKALKAAVAEFEKRKLRYCLIGGHAASLYRSNERVTRDVDFAIYTDSPQSSRKEAEGVIRSIGLKPTLGFIPGMSEQKRTGKICMITSTPKKDEFSGIIDILLPELPWIFDAVRRAQFNRIDLGFAKVPVITPEDLIVAKCYALSSSPDRFQDLDDIKELFANIPKLDLDYIKTKLETLSLKIPKVLKSSTPTLLKRLCK